MKIRGFRIELGEIEAALRQHPLVPWEAAVCDAPGGGGGARLVAYVAATRDASVNAAELLELLTKKLPGFMVPAAFVTLESLPLTPNGKIDRAALPEPELPLKTLRPGGGPAHPDGGDVGGNMG